MEQEDSLKKTIEILAELTKKDIQRLNNFSDTNLSLPKTVLISYPLLKEL